MGDRIQNQRKKAGTSSVTNPSLTLPTTPTLASPTRGFGSQLNNALSQEVQTTSNQQEAQPDSEVTLEEKLLQQKPLAHDISRVSVRPQARLAGEGNLSTTPNLETSIQQARGGGQLLAASIRQPMEQAFGADFSKVKIHTDTQSDQLNKSIQARAFTTEQDIFFRQGEYNPSNREGQELLAHELTHVVQQNSHAVQRHQLQRKGQSKKISQLNSFGTLQKVQSAEQVNEQPQEEDIFASYPELAETSQEDIKSLISSGIAKDKLKTILENCKQKKIKSSKDEKSYNVDNLIKGLAIGVSSKAKELINDNSKKPIMEEIINSLLTGGTDFQSAFDCVAYATYKNRWEPNLFKTIFKAIVLGEHLTVPRAFKDEKGDVNENLFKEFSQDYRKLLQPYCNNPDEIKIQGSANMDIPGEVKDIDIAILKNEGNFLEDMKKSYKNAIVNALVELKIRNKGNKEEITGQEFSLVINAAREKKVDNSKLRSLIYCFDRGMIKNSEFLSSQDKRKRDELNKKWMPKLNLKDTMDISIILKEGQFDKPPYITLAALEKIENQNKN